jgi:Sec-independent protein translocase protein TatA
VRLLGCPFGPGKLPDLGIRELKKALNEGTSAPKELSKPAAPEQQAQKPEQQT